MLIDAFGGWLASNVNFHKILIIIIGQPLFGGVSFCRILFIGGFTIQSVRVDMIGAFHPLSPTAHPVTELLR
jgi:hypothetical protein